MDTPINWNYPAPRTGLLGELDKFIGPGATPAELWIQAIFTLGATTALLIYARVAELDWTPLQLTLGALLALDMAGGISTNATSAAKRWYHRAGQGFRQHVGFVALHLVHIFLVAWFFRALDWPFFGLFASYLLIATIFILRTPLYLQRPLAFGLFAIAILLNQYAVTPTLGLEWFVPLLFFKLLVSHLLREEPYRPVKEQSQPAGSMPPTGSM